MPKFYIIKSNKSKRSLAIVAVFIIFLWICSQVSAIFSPSVRCEMVTVSTVEDSINVKGYVLRKETLIKKDTNNQCVVANLRNGQRVPKGGIIATIYDNEEDALTNKKIKEIDDELEKLKSLGISKTFLDYGPDEISRQICGKIRNISNLVDTSRQDEILQEREKLLELLNAKQIATGKIGNFNERISYLKKEREMLASSCKNKNQNFVKSPETGGFVDHIDGFENAFTFESILSMMPEDLNSLKEKQNKSRDGFVGKIVHDLPWYICFKLDSFNIDKLERNMSIEVLIPLITSSKIPAEIVSINKRNSENKEVLVICSCDYMNEKLINARENDMIINVKSYTGIKIPKNALHKKQIKVADKKDENITGVYALKGNSIVFREVNPIYYDKDYVICKQSPDPEILVTDNPIKIYDQVVVEGSDLYEDKIVK